MSLTPEIYFEAAALLGEGPVWDHRTGELHWVDIDRREIHRRSHTSHAHYAVTLDESVGAAVPLANGRGWVVGTRTGVFEVGLSGVVHREIPIDAARPGHRMNDGACDSRGRFWAGTLNDADEAPCDALYVVATDWRVTAAQQEVGLSNGLGWSPDDTVMYRVDSQRRLVYAADFDAVAGTRANERVLVDLSGALPEPDGLSVDAAGCIWVALWDGGCVARYSPAGVALQRIDLPVARPTSVAFGGDDFRTLFITTASRGVDQPHAGAIFAVTTDTPGLPANFFG